MSLIMENNVKIKIAPPHKERISIRILTKNALFLEGSVPDINFHVGFFSTRSLQ